MPVLLLARACLFQHDQRTQNGQVLSGVAVVLLRWHGGDGVRGASDQAESRGRV